MSCAHFPSCPLFTSSVKLAKIDVSELLPKQFYEYCLPANLAGIWIDMLSGKPTPSRFIVHHLNQQGWYDLPVMALKSDHAVFQLFFITVEDIPFEVLEW